MKTSITVDMGKLNSEFEVAFATLNEPNIYSLFIPSLPLSEYDAIEIHPVIETDGICEVTDNPAEASIWSVYLHLITGGVECIADFLGDRSKLAQEYANTIHRNTGWPVSGPDVEVVVKSNRGGQGMRTMLKVDGNWVTAEAPASPEDLCIWLWKHDGKDAVVADDGKGIYYCGSVELLLQYRSKGRAAHTFVPLELMNRG